MAQEKPIYLLLVGPPGAGKGTQAKILVDRYNLVHLATGDMLRAEIAEGTELGLKAKAIIERGDLVDDHTMIGMLASRLQKQCLDKGLGFVLDGFPRTKAQAVALDELLAEKSLALGRVLVLTIDDEKLVERLSQRVVCVQCGGTYHLRDNPPPEGKTDCSKGDECNIIQRDDDKPEAIRHRLGVFHGQTKPVLEHYRAQGIVDEIEADQGIDEVTGSVLSVIERLGSSS